MIRVAIFVILVSLIPANALKCWRCASDATSGFCKDPFDPSQISDQQRRWAYVDCSFPTGGQTPFGILPQSRAVCKKIDQLINGKIVTSRSCSWEESGAPSDTCMRSTTPSYIETKFCETCEHDGCNSQPMNARPISLTIFICNLVLLLMKKLV